jgi:lipopolysaccharide/colanic/teichoic acid biosynthesis glycosyltransferase
MINRVKLDVFYIENWFLDLKLFIKLWLISIKEKKTY